MKVEKCSRKRWQVINGDCRQLAELFSFADAIVADPPYGNKLRTKYKAEGWAGRNRRPIHGNDKPPTLEPILMAKKPTVLFGYEYFARQLPLGKIIVWRKKPDSHLGYYGNDCEFAWCSVGKGNRELRHDWCGFNKASERGTTSLHPTPKPVAVMRWCIEQLKLPKGSIIIDPYCGTGSTGVAALELGYRFIGIEIDKAYCRESVKRLKAA